MTQPQGNGRPEADVVPLVSFPFGRSVVAACAPKHPEIATREAA